jgi:hypothetical protein
MRPNPLLFTPAVIGPLTLKNRVIMAPMTTHTGDRDGFVTDDSIAYYVAGGAFRRAGRAPRFQNVEADPASLRHYVDALVRECEQSGVRMVYRWRLNGDDLKSLDHVVIATGAAYRLGLTAHASLLLRMRVFRLPFLGRIAAPPRVRQWFYESARRSIVPAPSLPRNATVTQIGDANRGRAAAGKERCGDWGCLSRGIRGGRVEVSSPGRPGTTG